MTSSWCDRLFYYIRGNSTDDTTYTKKYDDKIELDDKIEPDDKMVENDTTEQNDKIELKDGNYYLGEFDDYLGKDEGPIWF